MKCCGLNVATAYANWRDPPYPGTAHEVKLDAMDQQPPEDSPSAEAGEGIPQPKHDPGQKRLFSHWRMVADLLRLLPEGLTGDLDLSTLRRLPAEHVGDALRSRRSDMPWRIDFLLHGGQLSAGRSARSLGAQESLEEVTAPHARVSPRPPAPENPGTCLLLVEFQSTVDLRMAERMLEYAALLRRDLAR